MSLKSIRTPFLGAIVGFALSLGVLFIATGGPSEEQESFDWAVQFCGGKPSDISSYTHIGKGTVWCMDGRKADVPR